MQHHIGFDKNRRSLSLSSEKQCGSMFGGVGIFCFIKFSQPLPLGEGPCYMFSFLTLSRGSITTTLPEKKKKTPCKPFSVKFLRNDLLFASCSLVTFVRPVDNERLCNREIITSLIINQIHLGC